MKFWRARKISLQFLSNHILCPICSINKKNVSYELANSGDSNQNSYPARLNLTHLLNWRSKNPSKRENCAFRRYLVHFALSGEQDRSATIWIFFQTEIKHFASLKRDEILAASRKRRCCWGRRVQGFRRRRHRRNIADLVLDSQDNVMLERRYSGWKKNPRRFFPFVFATRLFTGSLKRLQDCGLMQSRSLIRSITRCDRQA